MLPTDKYNDTDFHKFVDQFLFATERKQEILQRALFPTILRKILSSNYEAEYELLPINMRSSNKLDLVLHLFWYCLWSFKWFLYFRQTRKENVITTSFFTQINSSWQYFVKIIDIAQRRKAVVINFGMIRNWKILFRDNVFCNPYLFEKMIINKIESYEVDKYSQRINEIVLREFPELPLEKYTIDIKRLLTFYCTINNFISAIQNNKKILFYLSDADNIDTRVIVCEIHKSLHVKTILLDHALTTFSHINRYVYSNEYWTWGKYHENVYKENVTGKILVNAISIIGNPNHSFSPVNIVKGRKWIYFLPSFQHQIALTNHRSFRHTKIFIDHIEHASSTLFPGSKFYIKLHPIDTIDEKVFDGVNIIKGTMRDILEGTELVFVEDSTVAVEILNYIIPIIYIADDLGKDRMKLHQLNCAHLLKEVTHIKRIIKSALNERVDTELRKRAYVYYFGDIDGRMQSFSNQIMKYLNN